jgi:hypothetical protein
MRSNIAESAGFKTAALLLLEEGEISVNDIEALPFVEDSETAWAIAQELSEKFDIEWEQRRSVVGGISSWEDILQLKIRARSPFRAKRDSKNIKIKMQVLN